MLRASLVSVEAEFDSRLCQHIFFFFNLNFVFHFVFMLRCVRPVNISLTLGDNNFCLTSLPPSGGECCNKNNS